MSVPSVVGDRPTLEIGGTRYPVLLPSLRDPRLHLAAVIISLQVLGQVAFEFQLSIAQILVAVLTSAILEVGIAFRRQRVLMWPASALLTGNGVAFILRVPGTEHGDWWSTNGAWIFAATAAIALLSKYLIQFRGRHIFNPSNFGLVLCFLALGPERADPLAFWWGPLSPALVVALAIIVIGGLSILGRLHLTGIAVGFWLAFAAGIGVLAASGHTMTAAWHVGPIEGADFWWTLVSSPEILVFLFFMITDPRTIPAGRAARHVYAIGVGLLATLLIAPFTTEFAAKVAVLGALFAVCAMRPVLVLLGSTAVGTRTTRVYRGPRAPRWRLPAAGAAALTGAFVFAGLVFAAGIPARPDATPTDAAAPGRLPAITVVDAEGIAKIDRGTARAIARDVVANLRSEADALRRRDPDRATAGATGAWLAALWAKIRSTESRVVVPEYTIERLRLTLVPAGNQGPPIVVARLDGTLVVETFEAATPTDVVRGEPTRFRRTVDVVLERGRYRIARSRGGAQLNPTAPSPAMSGSDALGGITLTDVAADVGLRFEHAAFRFGVSDDETAMMGGGLCWLDYDDDGWLDLFVVNAYAESDLAELQDRGGPPRTALFHNVRGRFEDVSRSSGADLPVRGSGCVAADFNMDGDTDLYVTTAGYNVDTDGYDALLWNDGDGTFTEGARAARINDFGWHAGAAVGDLNDDGRPDLVVTSYTDVNSPIPSSAAGFPTNHRAMRDFVYLNTGPDEQGRSRFREVGRQVGLEAARLDHGLGAVLTDVNRDGRLDLYVANDADPNRLYINVPKPGIGFRFEEVGRREAVDDANAGMGIAAADFNVDGRPDLFVSNSRKQLHAAYSSRRSDRGPSYADARRAVSAAFGTASTGWGTSWVDLDLDSDLDLALANGAIPVVNLSRDAERVQVLEHLEGGRFANVGESAGLGEVPLVNGRGLAAADYDNDGDVDLAINSIGGRLMLLRNTGASGHWLEVRLSRFSPGAVVTASLKDGRRLVREVLAGSSYLSSEDPRVHFGLGNAASVKAIEVRFPDGREVRRTHLASDQILVVRTPAR